MVFERHPIASQTQAALSALVEALHSGHRCLGVFQFADDPSQARLILADMILAKHFIAILTYGGFC